MSSPVQLAAGQIFATDFRVLRPLSAGGMGSVYVVQQVSTGAERALKLMHPELVADPRQRARFEQEARVGANIRSDHVVNVILAGVEPQTGLPYIVMELLDGAELGKMLHQRGILPRGEVVVVLSQLCHALAAAHAVGVVHRDLKPENVFIATSRRADVPLTVKILDFGIAKVVAELKNSATQTVGTPLYMAPEQGDARAQISAATDVWSLALLTFQMLTGKVFWLGASEQGSVEQIMAEVLIYEIPLASTRANELGVAHLLPPGFDAWFKSATERDTRLRFQNAGDAWRALQPILVAGITATNAPSTHASAGAYAAAPGMQTGPAQAYGGYRAQTPPQGGGYASSPGGYAPAPGYATGPQGYGAPPAQQGYATGGAYARPPGHTGGGYPSAPQVAITGYGAPPQVGGYTQVGAHGQVPVAGQTSIPPHAPPPAQPRKKSSALVPILAVGGVLALAGAGVGGYFLFRSTPKPPEEKKDKITFCDTTTTKFQVPVCVADVSDAQKKHRTSSFKIVERDGKVVQIDTVNSVDKPIEGNDGIASRTYEYDGKTLKRIVEKNSLGIVVSKRTVDPKGTEVKLTDAWDQPLKLEDTVATSIQYTLDDKGYVGEMRFFNARGKPTHASDNVYGYRFKNDDKGRVVSSTAIDAAGKPMRRSSVYTTEETSYDDKGFIKSHRYLDDAGKPVLAASGIAGDEREVDEFGNIRSIKTLGLDAKPTTGSGGYATIKYTRDDHGFITKLELFDPLGQPTYDKNGWSTQTRGYDADGNMTEQAFFDAGGAATKGERFVKAKTKYDERGQAVEVAYFLGDGKPEIVDEAFSMVKLEHDDRGNLTKRSYFDASGKPVLGGWWYASAKFTYDDHDKEIEQTFYDVAGKITNSFPGYAKITTKHDSMGNAIETAYFDAEGAAIADTDGVAKIVRGFDELGDQTSEDHFDEKGNPVLEKNGFASMKRTFDDNGDRLTSDYFNADGTRKKQGDRAGEKLTRDPMGNIITAEIIGENGEPASPIAKFTYTFDARGDREKAEGFDKDGKPAANALKTARYEYKHDERGNETEELDYDENGKLVVYGGDAGHQSKFDAWGREIERAFIGDSGKPAKNYDGVARWRKKLDPHGRPVEETVFDENDRPTRDDTKCTTTKTEYDLDGNVLHQLTFDPEGKPCLNRRRFAGTHNEYDARGNKVKTTQTDTKGVLSEYFLVSTLKYDDRSLMVEQTLMDRDGKPALNTRNIHHLTWKRDSHGRRIEENYFGTDGGPTLDEDGVATRRYEYDRRGNKTKESFFGKDGAPIASNDGSAWVVYVFDSADKQTRTEYHKLDGSLLRETPY